MGISKTPEINNYPVWGVDANNTNAAAMRYMALPTADTLKRRMLFGIPLKSSFTGETISDETLQDFINQAISQIEMELDIYVMPTSFQEKHDYNRELFSQSFAYLKLYHPNVLSVDAVQISFNNDTIEPAAITFPLEHVHVMPQEGALQLVPAYGTSLSGFLLSAFSGVQYHAFNSALVQNWPGGVRISYTAGFADGKVPAAVVSVIEKTAALKFLSMLGPVLFPATSTSISIDGVSQGSSNPGPAFLKQRMDDINTQLQQEMSVCRSYFQRGAIIDYI